MYYALMSQEDGCPISTGLNCTTLTQVRTELISLMSPQCEEDLELYSLDDLMIAERVFLEESEHPFVEEINY